MKILYLSADPKMGLTDPRGYGIHMTELIQAFRQIGNEVYPIVAGQAAHVKRELPHKRAIRRILPGRIIETARTMWDILSDCKSYVQAKTALVTFFPDFIYERYAVFHQSGVILSKKYRVPIILELNSPLSERDLHYGHRRRTLALKIKKRVLLLGDAIVVVSNFLRDYLLNLGIPASKIHVIPNAVDPNRFTPHIDGSVIRRNYKLDKKVVVGFVGGFSQWHGIESLLAAAQDVIEKIKHIHFLLVGEGNMREVSEKFVRDNGISEYVTFTGSVLYKDIPHYIAAMDITTMPCSNSHGSPIKIFEYMAMEKPIIAPRVGPVEEIIDDGKEGLLINAGNRDQLRDALLYLCDNEKLGTHMAKSARQKILKNYTWERNAERVIQIFLSLS